MSQNDTRITVKMIAQKAGTSIGTVDRALNNRGGVSEASKQHILKIAEELGYRPNKFASALGRKKALRIGIIYPYEPEEFYSEVTKGVDRAAQELLDYGIQVEKLRYSAETPAMVGEFLSQIDIDGFDGFAVNSVGGNMTSSYIDSFVENGKPTITFHSDLPLSSRLFFLGNNSWQSGNVAGELLATVAGKSGDVAILNNLSSTSPYLERCGGLYEYMHLYFPEIHLHPSAECYSNEELAKKALLDLLAQTPAITAVYCSSYATTLGAIYALKEINRPDIYIVGYDITEKTANALEEGWCNVILFQQPYRQGYQAVQLITKHILEGWQPPKQHIFLETPIVLKSNLDSYYGNNTILL